MARATRSAGGDESASEKNAPSGFRRVNSVTDAPWVKGQEGNVVFGKLINRYGMQGQALPGSSNHYYQIELLEACAVTKGKGDDAEVVEAAVGDIVNLGENKQIASLKDVVVPEINAGAEYQVWIKFKNKIKISGGRTMWNIEVLSKSLRGPSRAVIALPPETDSEGSDANPF
jgi:hypothetical protein